MLMHANCNDTPVVLRRHSRTIPDDSVVLRLMACVNGCFEADGPDRSWSEMSWDLGRREEHQAKTKYLTGFRLFIFLSALLCSFLSLPYLALLKGSSAQLLNDVTCLIVSSSPSFAIYIGLHTWVIKSMLFIKSIILPQLGAFWSLSLFVFASLPFELRLFLLTLLGLVLFSSLSPLLSSYLVLLPRSPTLRRAWQIVSVHETR